MENLSRNRKHNMKKIILYAVVLIMVGASGFGLQRYLSQEALPVALPNHGFSNLVGTRRPEFALEDLNGKVRNVREWDGKVLLINFWATWCPPCIKEMPLLIELQNKYGEQGLQIVGLAIDDEQSVRDFVDTHGITFPIVAAEMDAMELATRFGNRMNALPFTAIVDRNGDIVELTPGELSREAAEKIIQSLL